MLMHWSYCSLAQSHQYLHCQLFVSWAWQWLMYSMTTNVIAFGVGVYVKIPFIAMHVVLGEPVYKGCYCPQRTASNSHGIPGIFLPYSSLVYWWENCCQNVHGTATLSIFLGQLPCTHLQENSPSTIFFRQLSSVYLYPRAGVLSTSSCLLPSALHWHYMCADDLGMLGARPSTGMVLTEVALTCEVMTRKCFPQYWPFMRGIHMQQVRGGPKMQHFNVFFDWHLNMLLNKQPVCHWFEAPWFLCDVIIMNIPLLTRESLLFPSQPMSHPKWYEASFPPSSPNQ